MLEFKNSTYNNQFYSTEYDLIQLKKSNKRCASEQCSEYEFKRSKIVDMPSDHVQNVQANPTWSCSECKKVCYNQIIIKQLKKQKVIFPFFQRSSLANPT